MDTFQQPNESQTAKNQAKHNAKGFLSQKWQRIALCCVLVISILAAGLWAGGWFDKSIVITSSPSTEQVLSDMSKNLTEQLINDAIAYKNADISNRETALSTLHQTAAQRQEYIKTLMQEDPDAFLSLAITPDIRQELLQGIEGVETTVTLEGRLELIVEVADHNHDGRPTTLFFLVLPSGEAKSLHLPTSASVAHNPNDQVRVIGYELDGIFVPDTISDLNNFTVLSSSVEDNGDMASLRVSGTRQVAIILVNVNGADITHSPQHNFTLAGALQMFDDAKSYFEEVSYGQMSISGKLNPAKSADVFGIYNITTANLPEDYHCDSYYTAWYDQGVAAAAADGFVNSNYQHVMVWMNRPPATIVVTPSYNNICNWAGRGSVGESTARVYQWSFAGISTAIHELGHNLGLPHAGRFENCTIDDQSVPFAKAANCRYVEYGDHFSVMGSSSNQYGNPTTHINAVEKVKFGWIPAANVTTVDTAGTHTIDLYPQEESSAGTQLIRIPLPYNIAPRAGTPIYQGEAPYYYYLELRKPFGVQSNISDMAKNGYTGVQLRTGSGSTSFTYAATYLWTLGSLPGAETCSGCSIGIRPGMVFTDPYNPNMAIKVLSWAQNKATVEITLTSDVGPTVCARPAPTVTVSPSSSVVEPGGYVGYTVTATSNDSEGCFDTASYTTRASTTATGFSISPPTRTWNLAPGASNSQSFSATSPITAASGLYAITFTVTSNSDASISVSRTAEFIVDSGGDPPPPPPTPPTINISGVTSGGTISSSANTKITATAAHAEGISKVEIHINNQLVARCTEPRNGICDIFVKGSSTASGTHMLRVTATAKNTGQTTGTTNLTFNK